MRVSVRIRRLPKAGNRPDENEDICWPGWQGLRSARSFRFAVSDGATDSSFPALWAGRLARTYVSLGLGPSNLRCEVERLARGWAHTVRAKHLPWYALEKSQHGAAATLLGLALESNERHTATCGRWAALAVGDSCLFQIRASKMITCLPMVGPEQFNSQPLLISTQPASNETIWAQIDQLQFEGDWHAGDRFLLMTDALAQWFLAEAQAGEAPWSVLSDLVEQSKRVPDVFSQWIAGRRAARAVRNDDVSLLIIRMESQ